VRIATFNINNINKRLDNLLAWLVKAEPDVVSLQELKAEQGAFPVNALVIITPDFYEKNRQTVLEPRFVRVSGTVQNQDGIVHLRAKHIAPWQSARLKSHPMIFTKFSFPQTTLTGFTSNKY